MIRYINVVTGFGIETIDEIDSTKYNSFKEFRKYLKDQIKDYLSSGCYYQVYSSQRATKEYRERD